LIAAPKGTPESILTTVRASVQAALQDSEVVDIITNKIHWVVMDKELADLKAYMNRANENNKNIVAKQK
ncbi:MAG: hypothetical protein GY801_42100, partial [bacterium]|nr:hypothetical protein [bacterium]